MKHTILILISLLTLSCASSYAPNGRMGGYSEMQLADNVFKVSFKGNAYTDPERATDFALLRSAEVAIENGYGYFQITDSYNGKENFFSTSPTTTTTGFYGNRAVSNTTGGDVLMASKPSSFNTIVCYVNEPEDIVVYNAFTVHKSLSAKYGL